MSDTAKTMTGSLLEIKVRLTANFADGYEFFVKTMRFAALPPVGTELYIAGDSEEWDMPDVIVDGYTFVEATAEIQCNASSDMERTARERACKMFKTCGWNED